MRYVGKSIILCNITVGGTRVYHRTLELESRPPVLFAHSGLCCKVAAKRSILYMLSRKLCSFL